MPRYIVEEELATNQLRKILLLDRDIEVCFSFVTRKGATINRKVSALGEFIIKWSK